MVAPVDSIVMAVKDNGPQSMLNADRIIEAVAHPDRNAELHELLGEPLSARRSFSLDRQQDFWEDDYLALVKVSKHYVALKYREGTALYEIEQRLRADSRFSYVGVDTPGSYSATPTDQYFGYTGGFGPIDPNLTNYQWGSRQGITGLPSAWDRNKGWALVGLIDGGAPTEPATLHPYEVNYKLTHPDLQRIVANNQSWDINFGKPRIDGFFYPTHGAHVLGLIAANANNPLPIGSPSGSVGGAGVCWNCTAQYAQSVPAGQAATDAAIWLTDQGSQVVNLSGGYDRFIIENSLPPDNVFPSGIPCSSTPSPIDHQFCHALSFMLKRGTIFVAAAGNSRQRQPFAPEIQFPASEPSAIGVGGLDARGLIWDEADASNPWPFDDYDTGGDGDFRRCPSPAIYAIEQQECGSNYSERAGAGWGGLQEMDFVAPARQIVSTVPINSPPFGPYNDYSFTDSNFPPSGDGYSYASGTSMSSPIVAGIIALLRSSNPLISRNDVYDVLKATASNNGQYNGPLGNNKKAWGVPNAGAAIDRVHGKVAGTVVVNRVTPMFVAVNYEFGDRLYSTRPQVVLGAAAGLYLAEPQPGPTDYFSTVSEYYTSEGVPVAGYPNFPSVKPSLPHVGHLPRPYASFWVFASDISPWSKQADILKPLYRMSFKGYCDPRRHFYAIQVAGANPMAEIDMHAGWDQCANPFTGPKASFQYDGIEGYLMNACPPTFSCNNVNDPSEPQKLHRLRSAAEGMSALLLESELGLPEYSSYTLPEPGTSQTHIGFVFPNVDSDGDHLVDGLERLYGLNRFSSDSDCDGISDGTELPVAGIQVSGHDPLLGGTCP